MIEHRPFHKLSGQDIGWLKAKRHFSFDGSEDRARKGWGALRIWNDDEIAPDAGFPPHAHANMEIVTYVREGVVTHRDSLGNEGQTKAGDVQVMSAGTGIRHAEYNTGPVSALIFQIWIVPDTSGGPPTWGVAILSQGRSFQALCRVCQRLCKRYRCAAHSGSRPRAWSPAHGGPVDRTCLWRKTPRIFSTFVGYRRRQWRKDSRA